MKHLLVLVGGLLSVIVLAACCSSLRTADVAAPDINCVFDTDCTISGSDFVDEFAVPFASGPARLQSRSLPVGQPGTQGAGLYGHLYRVDLTSVGALTGVVCVRSLRLQFGPVKQLDYDGDGTSDDVFVVTGGGLGSVAPSSVQWCDGEVRFTFAPGVCPGAAPGSGETSYFFGLASDHPAGPVSAVVGFDDGSSVAVSARSPG